MEEKWLPWIKNPNYQVSNFGRVKGKKGFILKTALDRNGYEYVTTRLPNIRKSSKTRIHRMVLETFQPREDSENFFVDHINGIRKDNRLDNLRWVKPEQNTYYKVKNRKEINEIVFQLLQKYGYEETLKKLKTLE